MLFLIVIIDFVIFGVLTVVYILCRRMFIVCVPLVTIITNGYDNWLMELINENYI